MRLSEWAAFYQGTVREVPLRLREVLISTRAQLRGIEERHRKELLPVPAQGTPGYPAVRNVNAALDRRTDEERQKVRATSVMAWKQQATRFADAVEAMQARVTQTIGASVNADPMAWQAVKGLLDANEDPWPVVLTVIERAKATGNVGQLKALREMGPSYFEAKGKAWPEQFTRNIDEAGGGPREAVEAWRLRDWLETASYRVRLAVEHSGSELDPRGSGGEASVLPGADADVVLATNDRGREVGASA
jgi:hypothetical protein